MATFVNRPVGWYENHLSCREVKKGVCLEQRSSGSLIVREFGAQSNIELPPEDEVWILREESEAA